MENQEHAYTDIVTDFKSINFQILLDQFKQKKLKVNDTEVDGDIYLMENVFPSLLEGLERLSEEVEKYISEESNINYEVRARFNPCQFLSQYLMRNNPKFNDKSKNEQHQNILKYANSLRFERFFLINKQQIIQTFGKWADTNQMEFSFTEICSISKQLDKQFEVDFFENLIHKNRTLSKSKCLISYEKLIEELTLCCQHQNLELNNLEKLLD